MGVLRRRQAGARGHRPRSRRQGRSLVEGRRLIHLTRLWACALALTALACADSADFAPAPRADASVTLDAGRGDASVSSGDAGVSGDASPAPGVRIATLPAEILAVPPGGGEVLYLKSGVLNRVDPDGSDNRSLGLRPSSGFGPTPNMWFWSDADADGAVGTLSLYVPGTSTTTELEGRVATDAFTVSPDGRAALAVTRVRDLGANTTSTRAAALEWLPIDGPPRVLLDGFTLGPWDARTRQHACSPQLAVMSDRRALAIVCPTPGSAERALYAIDVVMSSVTEVARGVQSFLRPSTDGSFALFIDREQRFAGVSAAGDRVQRLIEPRRVTSVALLEGARFAYTTASKDVSFAGWPNMIPSSVLPLGADAIEAVSPDGRWLIFRQIRATSGLRDLFLINTVTSTTAPVVLEAEQTGYPGDDAFSLDSAHVQWFGSADANFIGAIRTRPTAGGPSVTLAEKGWIVSNHADPEQVVLLANARFTGGEARRLRVDLSVARRDGSAHRTIAVDVDPAAFELFPERDRAVFRVAEGVHAGLWVADLR